MTPRRTQQHTTIGSTVSGAAQSSRYSSARRTLRRISALVGLFGASWLLLAPREASAQQHQQFGSRGQLVIAADDLFDFSKQWVHVDFPTGTPGFTDTTTRFSFLLSARQGDVVGVNGPKISGHYFVIPNLSVGGSLGYEARGGDITIGNPPLPNTSTTTDKRGESTFFLMAKVGYSLMFNPILGFWFRGGIGYTNTGVNLQVVNFNHASLSHGLLNLEAPFIVSPVPNLAFYAAPNLNVAFAGSADFVDNANRTESHGSTYASIGLSFGVLGYFYVW